MNRLIIILMLIAMVLNISACKRDILDETAEPIVEIDVPKTETENEVKADTEVKTETKTGTVTETAPKEEIEPEVANDKAEPCTLTTENVFSPNEVVITLTLEESAKGKVYRPEDFPEIDCYNVFPYNYYPEEYHPEHKDRLTLALMLNEPSKEKVLEYVKIAEKDDRVYSACPNVIDYHFGKKLIICAYKKEGSTKEPYFGGGYSENDFVNLSIIEDYGNLPYNFPFCYVVPDTVFLWVDYDKEYYNNQKEVIADLLKDKRVRYVMPDYEYFFGNYLEITLEKGAEFYAEDYGLENVTVEFMWSFESREQKGVWLDCYRLHFDKNDKQKAVDTKAMLEKLPEFVDVYLDSAIRALH